MTRAKYFPVQFDQTQSMSIYYMNTECWKCWQFCFNLNRFAKEGHMGDNYKGDSTLKTFPFFPCQNKNQIHQKKWAFFPHFYLPLSLINWKVSTYENQNWKIQGKSFCINLAITVKYVILLMYMNCFFHCSMLCSYQLLYYLHLAFWYISA